MAPFKLSNRSIAKLNGCSPELQKLAYAVEADGIPFIVTCGYRGEEEQKEAFAKGNSRVEWPHSKHNYDPSRAIDVAPIPLDWNDVGAFKKLIEAFEEKAKTLGINIRTRIDLDPGPKVATDWPHIELRS